jgi:hypothetical protein
VVGVRVRLVKLRSKATAVAKTNKRTLGIRILSWGRQSSQ